MLIEAFRRPRTIPMQRFDRVGDEFWPAFMVVLLPALFVYVGHDPNTRFGWCVRIGWGLADKLDPGSWPQRHHIAIRWSLRIDWWFRVSRS